jgi:lipoic acid synthetase
MEAPRQTPPAPKAARGTPKPSWLKVPLPGGEGYARLKTLTRELGLHTVCEEARCPNIGECWRGEHATMTLMVLGDECTRRCRFCAVKTVTHAAPPDPNEPEHVGVAIAALKVGYVVITSVDRDDLPDGGASHFAACIRSIRDRSPATVVETLIPDYRGRDLDVLMAGPSGRPGAQRRGRRPPPAEDPRSALLLRAVPRDPARREAPRSGRLHEVLADARLGETQDEVLDSMRRLREADADFLTLGQYLRPSAQHAPVREYVTPERFDELGRVGREMGFRYVASGPLVRSSYKAGEFFAARMVRERRARREA